ncbi:MAG: tetratricopeptide repeat protein [Bacteroidota bacterium]
MRFEFLVCCILAAVLLVSCSAERKNVISKTFHNTTAHYNAYFYAKQNIQEIETILEDNRDNDYNNILKIYPELDSTLAVSYNTQVEEAIKKASIAIERHKNSKWVDDSYILVGLARHYNLDFVNAIETFKYVNIKSEDDNARHEALIRLLKTFIEYKEFNNAISVSDFLKKEKVSKKNEKFLHLNRAYFYEQTNNVDKQLENLVKAAPLLKKKDGKGRIYFMIGQIYQELGFDAEAFNQYKRCVASHPEYELDFYARLNMAQVAEIGKTKDAKTTRKLFQKLLTDKKNREFKDKIYFEMGEFEVKQHNLDLAIQHYKLSLLETSSNKRQKGLSYLRLGSIYYDSLRDYELAKAYYDSTVTALPEDYENYSKIKARQEILADFVMQLNVIYEQDSLLTLAKLDSAEVRDIIDFIIQEEEDRKKAAEEKAKKRQRQNNLDLRNQGSGISSSAWYFGNPSAVAQGQSEFDRIWGDRPLEDDWRRSNKEASRARGGPNASDEEVADANGSESTDVELENTNTSKAEAMFSQIPFAEAEKAAALDKIEEAYYRLGNIYKFNLEEEMNSANAFEKLLERFPKTEYEAEALYQLYLIYKELGDSKSEEFANRLIGKHPNTTFAKLVKNPNYTEESTLANEKLKVVYKVAYEEFEKENYDSAIFILNNGLKQYPETVFTPRLHLLKALIAGKTEDINIYQYQLSEFIEKNPDTDITTYARDLLEASRSFSERQRRIIGANYIEYFEELHYFIMIYENKAKITDQLNEVITAFNSDNFPNQPLQSSSLILNDELSMVMVSNFDTKEEAEKYFKSYIQNNPVPENTLNSKFSKFVISKSNFNIFYESKDPETYLRFFEKNYTNGS